MSRFAVLAVALCAFASTAFSTPVSSNSTTLEERSSARVGRGTYFEVGLGACGEYNVDTDHIVALSHLIYSGGSHCNKRIHITNTANNVQTTALVRDECMGCSANDIDMSPSLFEALGEDLSVGVLKVSWTF
ncbi:RlpA-like double-psi beta-barrel-protein domain-containing protein-containing protein [Amylocystis lapponica]|nr:RlpA-like double-psi beta-barrel-protein domain-containing protein-containing protein [Amylocystis lapponica]